MTWGPPPKTNSKPVVMGKSCDAVLPVTKTLPESVAANFELVLGGIEEKSGMLFQWLILNAEKGNGQKFAVSILCSRFPSRSVRKAQGEINRYVLSITGRKSLEFVDQNTRDVILPNTGAWKHLLPRSKNTENPFEAKEKILNYLGHEYKLVSQKQAAVPLTPDNIMTIELTPDLLIGVPHNQKMKDETRRYDESDYEYMKLTKDNYSVMMAHGMNVFNVNEQQSEWIKTENVYYWGIGGEEIRYPDELYRSNYIGPSLFFDEPMVHTRDHSIRPGIRSDPDLRKSVTPEIFFEAFKEEYHKAKYSRSTILLKELSERKDVDTGNMDFLQENLYTWETMPASALYQLSEGDHATPAAFVFETPGRFGASRILPELNMCFDCQIPPGNPNNLMAIITGFSRGAARLTDKTWGTSIYGQVMRSDTYWLLTNAYDKGATHFFFWDSYQLAAVPYSEYLSLSKNLREYAKNFPERNLKELKRAAEVAIVIPRGYNLGHVKMGIGNISGLPEMNREKNNNHGVKYGDVLNNFYIEIERCLRLGVEFDIFWDLDDLSLKDYREIVTIRDDGRIEIISNSISKLLPSARIPQRPEGKAPELSVTIDKNSEKNSLAVSATAMVTAGSAPIFYTLGADANGTYHNHYVLWELFGPMEEDYTDLWENRWAAKLAENGNTGSNTINFQLDKPGMYRLRVATTDLAGRSTVVWNEIIVGD